MAKRKKANKKAKCRTITFKREKKGGKILPKSKWKTVKFCG